MYVCMHVYPHCTCALTINYEFLVGPGPTCRPAYIHVPLQIKLILIIDSLFIILGWAACVHAYMYALILHKEKHLGMAVEPLLKDMSEIRTPF